MARSSGSRTAAAESSSDSPASSAAMPHRARSSNQPRAASAEWSRTSRSLSGSGAGISGKLAASAQRRSVLNCGNSSGRPATRASAVRNSAASGSEETRTRCCERSGSSLAALASSATAAASRAPSPGVSAWTATAMRAFSVRAGRVCPARHSGHRHPATGPCVRRSSARPWPDQR